MAPLAYLPVQLAQIELGEGLLGLVVLVADVVAVVSLIAAGEASPTRPCGRC